MGYSIGDTYIHYDLSDRIIDYTGFLIESFLLFYFLYHTLNDETPSGNHPLSVYVFSFCSFFLCVLKDFLPLELVYRYRIYYVIYLCLGIGYSLMCCRGKSFFLRLVIPAFYIASLYTISNLFIEITTLILVPYEDSVIPHAVFTMLYFIRRIMQNVIFSLFIRHLVHIKSKEQYRLQRDNHLFMAVIAVTFLLVFFLPLLSIENAYKTIMEQLLSLFFILLAFYHLILSETYYSRMIKSTLREQQLLFEQQYYQDLSRLYDNLRKIRHDMRSHVFIMDSLIVDQKYEELHQYFRQFEDTLPELALVDVGNPILNAVLNNKLRLAQRSDIPFDLKVSLPEKLQIRALDLCSIISNLCDNAIEASKSVNNKSISLNIHAQGGYLSIIVKNKVDHDVLSANPSLTTTKKAKELHGQGIQIIKKIVKEYDGMCRFQVANMTFISSIQLKNQPPVS